MNNMKSTFLFLLTTTMMTCTAYGQSSNHKENKLPDWAFGGFERPKNVNPVISPIENTKFYCPLTKDSIAWESNDTFNPAATLYNGEIVVLYRAEDNQVSVSDTGLLASVMPLLPTAHISNGKRLLYSIRIMIHKKSWNGPAAAKTHELP